MEIVDLPNYEIVIFHSFLYSLPEGNMKHPRNEPKKVFVCSHPPWFLGSV